MKLTPSSTARRRTAIAALRSFGGPQMPCPVRRMAPKPRRWTVSSPPSDTVPAKLAEISFALIVASGIASIHLWDGDNFCLVSETAATGRGRERCVGEQLVHRVHVKDVKSKWATAARSKICLSTEPLPQITEDDAMGSSGCMSKGGRNNS